MGRGWGVTQPISLIHKFLPCFSMIKYYIDIWQVALYLSLICIDQGMLNDMINFNTDLFFCYPDRTFLSESPKSWSRFYEEIISSRGGPLRCISAIDVMGLGGCVLQAWNISVVVRRWGSGKPTCHQWTTTDFDILYLFIFFPRRFGQDLAKSSWKNKQDNQILTSVYFSQSIVPHLLLYCKKLYWLSK